MSLILIIKPRREEKMKSCQQHKVMETLLQGHGCAHQLQLLMDSESSMDREDLAQSVLHCFSDALSILIDSDSNTTHDEYQSTNSSPQENSSPVLESSRKSPHKRGRKTSMAESSDYRRHESANPIYHDGALWRKYGQKQIKESHHQRSYYKCAYSKDQNCEAKKQVQMIQQNPPLYSTTYFGRHTCQLHQAYANFPIDTTCDTDDHQGSHMIRFDLPSTSFSSPAPQDPTKVAQYPEDYLMSPEVAHAVEAFGFNPSSHFS